MKRKAVRLGPFTFEEYMEEVRRFHTYPAPGVILGGFMVEKAREYMPSGTLYNALSETSYCLPDAIQLLTPCTIGNGWLRIVDVGRFALALYDKGTGEGMRVGLDYESLKTFAELNAWFLKLKSREQCDADLLIEQIREAKFSILRADPVRVRAEHLRRSKKQRISLCPSCGEAYPAEHGTSCLACQGQNPYIT